ncbi:peroxisomal membrane protein PEX14 isoform X3 [Setaria italica]|uniref:peroxisomal membrane protein PEX14 isoform X3 n=1 Tax=Setaria italica TaxID=4555 RepID=UPI0006491861|nr:peroxisomal membrane protein PEX14 isoform X3 [Setaria italica]XP_034588392.1 peroxisomal membrane protein PEX14-like isoform X3 [Setaria viridis]
MADLSTIADGDVTEEAKGQEADQGSSEGSHGTTLQDTMERDIRKGKAALESTELMREDLVQSAVSFLKHPKVVTSSDGQRRSFLENKGLTVDEIDEAFRQLQETEVGTKCMDGSERVEPETEPVAPVVPCHPKSYMEIMEMIQRGERPDDIQDINDDPPNPDQPISEPRMAPKPKPWEKQGQESLAWDLKSPSSVSSDLRSEVQHDITNKAVESADGSNHGDSLVQAEVDAGLESPTDDAASLK